MTPTLDMKISNFLTFVARRDQFPSLIAYATSEAEVASLVRCGRSTGVQVVPRSGGHRFVSLVSTQEGTR